MDNIIGQRIKQRRKELKITQPQVAEQTSISSGNLSCIENGKYLPSAVALIELSKILDCSIDWMLLGNSSISDNVSSLDIEESNTDKKLLELFHGMSEDDQDEIMMLAQLKYNRLKKYEEERKRLFNSLHEKDGTETA